MKNIYLTHQTALRALAQPVSARWPRVLLRQLDLPARNAHDIRELELDPRLFGPPPYHVLVQDAHLRTRGDVCQPHLVSMRLPEESFLQAAPGIYVTAPELTFVLGARSFGLVQGIRLGLKLCGTYLRDPRHGRGMPATNVNSIAHYLARIPGLGRKSLPQRALRYLADGSASPMETALLMLLCLPAGEGGFGLPLPAMNPSLRTNPKARGIVNQEKIRPDLCYQQANLAIEYDSDQEHVGSERIADDSIRRLGLEAMGYTVVTITRRQIYSIGAFQAAALEIAHRLGIRTDRRKLPTPEKQDELRVALLANYQSVFSQ